MTTVAMRGITKRFGAVVACRGASLDVRGGELLALVGENGAGKSTLMRILAGVERPDAGSLTVDGRDVTAWTAAAAIAAGVGMVYQHFTLVPTLTVTENVVLGREPRRGPMFDRLAAEQRVSRLADDFGFPMDVRSRVEELSVGEAQRVEILKVLFRGARLVILDEPTAVLTPPEVQGLWRVLRRLRAEGTAIVLITHKLDEVKDVADRITVMRDGATVAQLAAADATPAEIAHAMVGREVVLGIADASSVRSAEPVDAEPVLEARQLSVSTPRGRLAVDRASFAVQRGRVFGIAGVDGNGQHELVEALAGVRPSTAGSILLHGRDITALDVAARKDAGVAHIPDDRQRRGLVLDFPVRDDLVLGHQRRFTHGLSLDFDRIAAHAAAAIVAFDIRPTDPVLPARALSGGNQQKVVVAREMAEAPAVLLAAHPTRGVDVGAVETIHSHLRRARDAGAAILLVSAELSELLALADSIAVMYRGRLSAPLARRDATEERLGAMMTGAMAEAADA